jgi:hypothetical protein
LCSGVKRGAGIAQQHNVVRESERRISARVIDAGCVLRAAQGCGVAADGLTPFRKGDRVVGDEVVHAIVLVEAGIVRVVSDVVAPRSKGGSLRERRRKETGRQTRTK